MLARGISKIIPSILLGLFTKPSLHRIVVHVNQVGAHLLFPVFRSAPERRLEKWAFPMAGPVVLAGKAGSIFLDEGRQVVLPVGNHAPVNVVRHLAQLQYLYLMLGGCGTEDGEKDKVVTDVVENDVPGNGPLVSVVKNTPFKESVLSLHILQIGREKCRQDKDGKLFADFQTGRPGKRVHLTD